MTAPDREGYCGTCCRMIPIKAGRLTLLDTHYSVLDLQRDFEQAKPCTGRIARPSITYGMEDPRAAFR